MDHRINLKKFNGHWFMDAGTKGYACTTQFEEFLNKVKPSCVIISDCSENPWFSVKVTKGEQVVTEFLEPTTEALHTMKQCPKMFEDLDLPTQFYINRGDS